MSKVDQLKQQLIYRQQELEKRLEAIKTDISHTDKPLSADWEEQATEKENDEVLNALGNASVAELVQIKSALKRIEQGCYQRCTICEDCIPLERLEVLPHTSHCDRCAEELEAAEA
ncbi:TraR/DksA family transcriptional regulator [Aliikangiella sp. G2MR2-5]|uniref:TraR/DksA family transcriptional regulator n=1 Tax=Aliikangiella sp. G2MR2-5 TaxID=2788943 RepID=UPI0018A8BE0A|nr:TraR/DksA family transcriptional regulator [Aliikangiella sp. G2MR2-5]